MRTCVNGHQTIEHGGPSTGWCSICGEAFVDPHVSFWIDWRAIILATLGAFVLLMVLCAGLMGLT